jgi:hypothetical protein
MQGILTAGLNGKKEHKTMTGTDNFDLTMKAIFYIMNKAIDNKLWACGRILLKDKFGNILKEMPAKDEEKIK